MLSKTVSEMELCRVSELVQLDEKETEEALSEACVSGMLWLKLDRVSGRVRFEEPKSPENVLSEWSGKCIRGK